MPSEKPKTQKQTSIQEPWGPSQEGLKQSIKDATGLYGQGGLTFDFPENTVAPLAPETMDYWNLTANRAMAGSPLTDASKGYIGDVVGGKYLNADAPGFSDVLAKTRDQVNGNYASAGRYGGGYHDAGVARELGALTYQNYARERGLQDSAARFAPQLAQQDYFDLGQLGQVGQQRQQYAQALTDQEVERQQWDQQKQANAIALYQSLLAGNMGGTTTAKMPGQATNPWLTGLGALTSLGGSYLGAGGTFGL
jgi:hypothetical protein